MLERNKGRRVYGPDHRHIAGMLMEEAVLYLLEMAGYRTVFAANDDPTLREYNGELTVLGLGGEHQIDGIADFAIRSPFSHQQRLLVEVKFHRQPIDIGVIRHAVAVLQDVREYAAYNQNPGGITRPRYHYIHAIFSASGYTQRAQQFAYAHDIYLIPLARSAFIRPILKAIRAIEEFTIPTEIGDDRRKDKIRFDFPATYDASVQGLRHPELRRYIRANIRGETGDRLSDILYGTALQLVDIFCERCRQINGALFGLLDKQVPVFLIPDSETDVDNLRDCLVQVYWNAHSWYLQLESGGHFSFDLPVDILKQYEQYNVLTEARALDLKADHLSEIQTTIVRNGRVRVVTFRLDMAWLESLRSALLETFQRRNFWHQRGAMEIRSD